MAFNLSYLRDGTWATRRFEASSVLATRGQDEGEHVEESEPPPYGILTRTVVESSTAQWIIRAQVRSEKHNDLVFVGSNYVQVTELGPDGQTYEVASKHDFGAGIRNAAVIGQWIEPGTSSDSYGQPSSEEPPLSGVSEGPDGRVWTIPPQFLVVFLETGSLAFLYVKSQSDGTFAIQTMEHLSPRNVPYLGRLVAVDPSSRYIASASSEGSVVVYDLESWEEMNDQHIKTGRFSPVKEARMRRMTCSLTQMTFLYPRPDDTGHIMLLLTGVQPERRARKLTPRIIVFDWEKGEKLTEVLTQTPFNLRLPDPYGLPVLLMPLTIQSAFIVACEGGFGIFKNLQEGFSYPEFIEFPAAKPSPFHYGVNDHPLWVQWSRPFRRRTYFESNDIIYLAREDGVIVHMSIDEDGPSLINVGHVNANIDTAFTVAYGLNSDLLVVAGTTGAGGVWKLAPRAVLEQVSSLPCWSPVVDFTTTNLPEPASSTVSTTRSKYRSTAHAPPKADRMFSASGRGVGGSIIEWRWGFEARIGLDIDIEEPIRRSWAFRVNHKLNVLLSLPDSSMMLEFSENLDQVEAVAQEDTAFDLSTRTLAAVQITADAVVQVTESSITFHGQVEGRQMSLGELLPSDEMKADYAACREDVVALITHDGNGSRLHVIHVEGTDLTHMNAWPCRGQTSYIGLMKYSQRTLIVVGSVQDGLPWISIYELDGTELVSGPLGKDTRVSSQIDPAGPSIGAETFEAMTSIVVLSTSDRNVELLAGTRCGHLIRITVKDRTDDRFLWETDRLGIGPVSVSLAATSDSITSVLVCCDDSLILVKYDTESDYCRLRERSFVWATESNDSSIPSPPIHAVTSLGEIIPAERGSLSAVILSGSRILLADIGRQARHTPRAIPIGQTPTRVIYSRHWKCLIVASVESDKPNLSFIDPDTGSVLSSPVDREMQPVSFTVGLGQRGDRIFGLYEWKFEKDSKSFWFIIATTKQGYLLIISVNHQQAVSRDERRPVIQYWTRSRKKFDDPVYAVVGDADGLVYCVDKTLHYDVLDLAERKLKTVKTRTLSSPATSLSIANGKILALTTMESIQVIDHRANGNDSEMAVLHSDVVTRSTVHMIDVGGSAYSPKDWELTLTSTYNGDLALVWIPWGKQRREFKTLGEAVLRAPIRRFAQARRPTMFRDDQPRTYTYGVLQSPADGSDILGVSVDGMLQQVILLKPELWRLLAWIQNTARRQKEADAPRVTKPVVKGPHLARKPVLKSRLPVDRVPEDMSAETMELGGATIPNMMHIDGDNLVRIRDERSLEKIFSRDQDRDVMCRYLDGLEDGGCTMGLRDEMVDDGEMHRRYFAVAYEVLDYVLAPIM